MPLLSPSPPPPTPPQGPTPRVNLPKKQDLSTIATHPQFSCIMHLLIEHLYLNNPKLPQSPISQPAQPGIVSVARRFICRANGPGQLQAISQANPLTTNSIQLQISQI